MVTSSTKGGLLATGTALTASGITMLIEGTAIEGALLAVIGVGLLTAYEYFDNRMKGVPSLPDGVDEQFFHTVAEETARAINQRTSDESDSNSQPAQTVDKQQP